MIRVLMKAFNRKGSKNKVCGAVYMRGTSVTVDIIRRNTGAYTDLVTMYSNSLYTQPMSCWRASFRGKLHTRIITTKQQPCVYFLIQKIPPRFQVGIFDYFRTCTYRQERGVLG